VRCTAGQRHADPGELSRTERAYYLTRGNLPFPSSLTVSSLTTLFPKEPPMPPAARVTDMHACPAVTVLVPHVGGPILPPGVPTVMIANLPAATVGSQATCTGPPDAVLKGSMTVTIGGKPAARMGDSCAHGGTIVKGEPTVMIGG
jgi:uncharacterized Zn-binding protein involved in type VI secretion